MAFTKTVGPGTSINGGASGTTVSVTLNGCTAGNAIVFGIVWDSPGGAGSTATPAISGESPVMIGTAAFGAGSNGNANTQLGYCANLASSGNKTLTITTSVTYGGVGLWAMEVAGGATSSFLDVHAEGSGTSSAPSLSLTTTQSNDLIIAMVAGGTGADPTQGTGYTLVPITQFLVRNAGEYKLDAGAAGSNSPAFTLGASDTWAMAAAAFKLAGAGGISRPVVAAYNQMISES